MGGEIGCLQLFSHPGAGIFSVLGDPDRRARNELRLLVHFRHGRREALLEVRSRLGLGKIELEVRRVRIDELAYELRGFTPGEAKAIERGGVERRAVPGRQRILAGCD